LVSIGVEQVELWILQSLAKVLNILEQAKSWHFGVVRLQVIAH
jgi:hypothetical protein